ncbi:PPE domain-containing protein [Actinophytocola gossypii]|uniref:PPE domain-containing protein n=1 Tax=Actinophytocola gossypii TaxID=2812003 RepID=A0ABT2JE79_9PSEU|nr:PPE domain-containing protein [Actinophytocola gossypii]MCT2586184.1 PPE domain-containing protein [Actinophytocola gossypii]
MTEPTPEVPAGETPRWRGHTHKELYLMLHEGPGAAASAEPSRRWQEIAAELDEIGLDLRKALEQSGAGWSGRAAGRAYDRLSVTAAWATETSTAAAHMRTAVEDQGDHIAKARADMPPPEDVPATAPDPTVAPAAQVARTQTDLETAEASANSAEERAFEVMAAYELNSETNTAGLSVFTDPPELVERGEMHHGGGVGHHEVSRPSWLLGWLRPRRQEHRRPWWHHFVGGDRWEAPTTSSSAPVLEQPAPRAPAPAPAPTPPAPAPNPGGFSGAVLAPVAPDSEERRRKPNRSTAVVSGGSAPAPSAPAPKLGADLNAAAASQVAATAHHTNAPVAPTTAAPVAHQDRMALRRFGVEAIGSSQWFGDDEEPVVGESPRRRWDLREPAGGVTEAVSILGEEHQLPPTVIGDGHTPR